MLLHHAEVVRDINGEQLMKVFMDGDRALIVWFGLVVGSKLK